MIRKSGQRFSEKIMRKQKAKAEGRSHRASAVIEALRSRHK